MVDPATRRAQAAIAAVVVLVFGACTGDDGDEDTTPQPSEPDRVEVLSDFQLVGEIDEAFAGAEPPVDVPDADEAPAPEDDDVTGPTLGPDDEAQFGGTSPTGGVMRVVVEDVSEELSTRCGLIADDAVDVYWTTDTSFDPDDVVNDIDGIEDEIEGRIAGVAGRILSDDDADAPRPTVSVDNANEDADATGSPDLFDTEDLRSDNGSECLLVADQVGFESDSLSTPSGTSRPVAPRVIDTPEPTEEPEETEEPADTPKPTKKPANTPRETATSTAEED